MNSKYSRLQNFVHDSKTEHSSTVSEKNENERSGSKNLFRTNIDRLQDFFTKYSNSMNDGSSSGSDDIQGLLQKGDNDPILPALVGRSFCQLLIIS
jgi:hypothetical protein